MTSETPPSESLRRPAELDQLDLGRSAVIEASAGTGKTYLLEHLVLELLITGRARLDEILIVTFTERATAELVARVRKKVDDALAAWSTARIVGWTVNSDARARLVEARRSFDQATISTIHSFCQGILTDEPLATRRLLGQTQVDGRQIFGEVFRDVLRRTLTTDRAHLAYLDAYLGTGRGVESLEDLLYRAATTRGAWATEYDETKLRDVTERLAALDLDAVGLEKALRDNGVHPRSVTALVKRLRRLIPEAQTVLAKAAWGRILALLDTDDCVVVFPYFEKIAALTNVPPVLVPLHDVARRALHAAPPLDEALAQRFLPIVESRLHARKLAEGLYDYDDMIRAVDDAIEGDRGQAMVAKLRKRYRFALVDEAQDTEPAQWRIFRRVFLDSDGPHPVVLIGDPKQAIYGFRGADVHTYVQAREDIRARDGTVLSLSRNFRSHPEVVAATNAIFDHQAKPRYFSGDDITYDHPVTADKPPLGTGPGVTLFDFATEADRGTAARIGTIKRALRDAIVAEIRDLQSLPRVVRLAEIYVLTRSNAEAREIATDLHRAGIANILFKPDDIFKSLEAAHVRALLLAIADPTDRAARLRAWLTPFFGVGLDDLASAADPPPDHPLLARLTTWKALADGRAYDHLWARILDDSGVARRLLLSSTGARRLTNYRHLFDILHAEASARPTSTEDLVALLGAFAAGYRRTGGADDDAQRLETEADAVHIMTIHAAKGLEADVVFLYGGLTARWYWRGVHALHENSTRLRCAGKPRRQEIIDLIKSDERQEDERLLYVALTRARKHLYLPFFPGIEPGDLESQGERTGGDFDPFSKITGEYRHVNQRLRVVTAEPGSAALFRKRAIASTMQTARDGAVVLAAIADWTPRPDELTASANEIGADRDREAAEALRARCRGFDITSYSRLSSSEGGHAHSPSGVPDSSADGDAPDIVVDLDADADADADTLTGALIDPLEALDVELVADETNEPRGALPGGIASGLFLHAILEKATLGELPPLPAWRQQAEVRGLIENESRRWDRDPRYFDETARLVHAGLTVPIRMPDGSVLPGLARAARVRREVDFLFPLPTTAMTPAVSPEDRLVHERGFVRGSLDVLFEYKGRVCFADWKSNVLSNYSAETVRMQVSLNYELQIQIYTLAVVRMLGIANQAEYERRFGGIVYLFLRGLTESPTKPRSDGDGLYVHRPTFNDVERWTRALAARRVSSSQAARAGGGAKSGEAS